MSRSKSASAPAENTVEPAALRAQQQALALASRPKEESLTSPPKAPDSVASRAGGASAKDTTTVPAGVRDRFLQVGEKWFFPNGDPAFKDLGGKLTTRSENAEIVRSLVEIAQARGWDEITVGGTKDFKRAVWHEAALHKIGVRGYTPTEIDEARLVRAMARRAEGAREHDGPSAAPPEAAHESSGRGEGRRRGGKANAAESALRTEERAAKPPAADAASKKVMYGRLVAHGAENYRLDPNKDMSYFVKVQTADDRVITLWGRDLERAIQESKSQPKIGDRIGVRHMGEKPVTVPKKERDGQGNVIREYDLSTHRNEWIVETEQFFRDRAKLADVVRDSSIDERRAVEAHPELAGTYVALNGAQLLAKRRSADQRDQERFVDTIRRTMAREIRRGDPLYVPALRDKPRAAERAARSPAAPGLSSPVR